MFCAECQSFSHIDILAERRQYLGSFSLYPRDAMRRLVAVSLLPMYHSR